MTMLQRSDDWFAARCGKVTASRVADLMAKTKTGYSTSRQNYMAQLICERLTGKPAESFNSAAMQRGTEKEPEARAIYMLESGEIVEECGLIIHPDIPEFGASPDGLVCADGLIEIKCPNTWTHLETLKTGKPKGEYLTQMQAQMACTGRQWCDFVSFDDRLPDDIAYFCKRIRRDDEFIGLMMAEISIFLGDLQSELDQINMRRAA